MNSIKIILLGLLLIAMASLALAAADPVDDNSQLSTNREEIVVSADQTGEPTATGELDSRMDAVPKSWSNIKSLWN